MRRAKAALLLALPLLLAAAPETPPNWSPRAVKADARTIPAGTTKVREGETLGHVAIRTHAGVAAIARANRLDPPYRIRPGQTLKIPAGRYHLVRDGEAGIAIGRAYGVPWAKILDANGITEPYILKAGQRLLIPAPDRPPTLEERAAAFHLDIDDILTGGEPALSRHEKPTPPTRTAKRKLPADAAVAPPQTQFTGRFDWPLKGKLLMRFGPQADGRLSEGLSIETKRGTPVKAAADGVVAYAGAAIPALGKLVLIRHGNGWISAYGHADTILVTRGQAVKRGQAIARAGTSGYAPTPRLMFQLRHDRAAVDPLPELPPI